MTLFDLCWVLFHPSYIMLLFTLSNQRSTHPMPLCTSSEKIFLPDAVYILPSCSNVKTDSISRISGQVITQFRTEKWNKKPLREQSSHSLKTCALFHETNWTVLFLCGSSGGLNCSEETPFWFGFAWQLKMA